MHWGLCAALEADKPETEAEEPEAEPEVARAAKEAINGRENVVGSVRVLRKKRRSQSQK